MAPEKAPAFQFYPKDFLTDGHVAAMSLAERGAYMTLLCLCWQEGSLPSDTKRLGTMVGVTHRAFLKVWPAIAECFHEREGRLIQRRLDRERAKQANFRRLQSVAGQASAVKRAQTRANGATGVQPTPQPNGNRRATGGQPKGNRNPTLHSPISNLRSPVSDLLSAEREEDQPRGTSTDPRPPKTPAAGDARFARFWACYPNKKGKDDAWRAWQKRHPSEALTDLIVAAVAAQTQWPEWTKDGGRYIPHPATWLNRGSWDDEPAPGVGRAVSDTTRDNLAARDALLARTREGSS